MDWCPPPVVPRRAGRTIAAVAPHRPAGADAPMVRRPVATIGRPAPSGGGTAPTEPVAPVTATTEENVPPVSGPSVPTAAAVVGGHPLVAHRPAAARPPPVAAVPIDRS